MKKIMTNNDLAVGMILTCRNGDKYVVVADDNGHHDVIALNKDKPFSNGIEVGTGKLAVVGGNSKGGRDIVLVQEFEKIGDNKAVPTRNRLSEALKMLKGQPFIYELVTVWQEEDPAVAKAKKELKAAEAKVRSAKDKLNRLGVNI